MNITEVLISTLIYSQLNQSMFSDDIDAHEDAISSRLIVDNR